MRLLLVQPHGFMPGPSSYAQQLYKWLSRLGQDATLIYTDRVSMTRATNYSPNPRSYALPSSKMPSGFHGMAIWPLNRLSVLSANCRTLHRALQLNRRTRCEIVHVLDAEFLTFSVINALARRPRHLLISLRGYEFWTTGAGDDSWDRQWYTRMRRFAWRRVNGNVHAVAESDWVCNRAISDRLISPQMIHVVPHPIWDAAKQPDSSRIQARKALGLEYDGPLFLIFGHRPRLQKSLVTILAALERLPRNFRLLIAGMEREREVDEQLLEGLARVGWNKDAYCHLAFIPEETVGLYFAASDALLLSYRRSYLGSSGVLALACAYEVPVIASDAGDLGENVSRSGLGITFRTEDAGSLADAITRFLSSDRETLDHFRKNLRKEREERSWPRIAARYLELYEKIARGAR